MLCVVWLLSAVGCGDGEEPAAGAVAMRVGSGDGREQAVEPGAVSEGEPVLVRIGLEEELDIKKWNCYIGSTQAETRLIGIAEVYFRILGFDADFVPDARFDREAMHGWATALDEEYAHLALPMEEALVMAERGEPHRLDAAAVAYVSAMKNLLEALHAAAPYYRGRGSVEGGWTGKPAEYHTRIVAAWEVFRPLSDSFDALLEAEDRVRQQRELQYMRAEGQKVLEAALTVSLETEKALDEIARQGIHDDNMEALDREPLKPHYRQMALALLAFEREAAGVRQLEREKLRTALVHRAVESGKVLGAYFLAIVDPEKSAADVRACAFLISELYEHHNIYVMDYNEMLIVRSE